MGACIAFEIGLQLEKLGEKVQLTLIDGSHSYVAMHTGNRHSKQTNKDDNEADALTYFILQFLPVDFNKVTDYSKFNFPQLPTHRNSNARPRNETSSTQNCPTNL